MRKQGRLHWFRGPVNKNAELIDWYPLTTRSLGQQRWLQESEVADVRHETAERSLASSIKGARRQIQRWQHSQTLTTCENQAWNPLEARPHRRERCPRGRGASAQQSMAGIQEATISCIKISRHNALNKMVETPSATERQVPTLQSSAQESTVQTALKAWKLSSRNSSTWTSRSLSQREIGYRRSRKFLLQYTDEKVERETKAESPEDSVDAASSVQREAG